MEGRSISGEGVVVLQKWHAFVYRQGGKFSSRGGGRGRSTAETGTRKKQWDQRTSSPINHRARLDAQLMQNEIGSLERLAARRQ